MIIKLEFEKLNCLKKKLIIIGYNIIRRNKKTIPNDTYTDRNPDKKILQRVNPSFLGSKWESDYIVGPYIKEIKPKDPWLKTRLGYDDVFKQISFRDQPKTLQIILIDHVPGIGIKGNVLEVDEKLALTNLIPLQKAVFSTPENFIFYKEIIESGSKTGPSSALSTITVSKLQNKIFLLSMSGKNEWILTKNNVKVNLRKQNLKISENAIELPEIPVIGPNKKNEGKDLVIYLTVNNNEFEKVPVRFMLHHLDEELNDSWYNVRPRIALLNEQVDLISSLPEPPIIEINNFLDLSK